MSINQIKRKISQQFNQPPKQVKLYDLIVNLVKNLEEGNEFDDDLEIALEYFKGYFGDSLNESIGGEDVMQAVYDLVDLTEAVLDVVQLDELRGAKWPKGHPKEGQYVDGETVGKAWEKGIPPHTKPTSSELKMARYRAKWKPKNLKKSAESSGMDRTSG